MLLEIGDLRTSLRTREGVIRAVDGVSLEIAEGATMGLVGESGCGKSMLALSAIGLLPESAAPLMRGSVRFAGRELSALSERALEDIRGREIGMIFQDPMASLNPTVTVGNQIAETLRRHLRCSRRDARTRSIELLEEVRIPRAVERLDDYPHQFSGGMRQRVMIAIAISCQPKLLLADEPTTALDATVQAEILALLVELRRAYGMAMLLITHDIGVVAQVADEVAVMYAGQIVERAAAAELFERPEHPYTEALLAALPKLHDAGIRHRRLTAIPGQPPDLIEPAIGCRFAPRCPYASGSDLCSEQNPPLRELRPGHFVRSFHSASERAASGRQSG